MSNDNDGPIYANAFGGKFPVCDEKQKVQLEEAFAQLLKDYPSGLVPPPDGACMCSLIIDLITGKASKEEQIAAGVKIAQQIYEEKSAAAALMDALGSAIMDAALGRGVGGPFSPGGKKETVH